MNFIKAKLFKLAIPIVLLGIVGCARNEMEPEQTVAQESQAEQTIEVDLHIEATATMPEVSSEARAGGSLQLVFENNQPLFRITDQNPYSTDTTLRAHCVFMRLKEGSTTDLDPQTALYGDVYFKRKEDSAPSIVGGKSVAVDLISDGKVTLKGKTTIKKDEQWYMMGLVGGKPDSQGRKVQVSGIRNAIEKNGGVLSGLDTSADDRGGLSVPFLSRWTKLAPAKDDNVVTSKNPINFRFQGILFVADIKNDTEYNLRLTHLQLQSTELTQHVTYDLMSSTNINDTEDKVTWSNDSQTDLEGRWYITPMGMYAEGRLEYRLDPKTQATNGNYLYDATEPKKTPASVIFWVNSVEPIHTNKLTKEVRTLPYRTGFFISAENREAKPTNATKDAGYKYVYSTDPALDEIVGATTQKSIYSTDIQIAPSMNYVCTRAIQKSLAGNRGKFVYITLKVPERPVMPIETIAQANLYDLKKGAKQMQFVPLDGANKVLNSTKVNYGQEASYAYQLADFTNSYWMLPDKHQWFGVLLPGNNVDNVHNWNAGEAGSGIYNWIESKVKETITFSDGKSEDYYVMYGRPKKGNNDNRIYGLRFFSDAENLKGSNQFSLTKYEFITSAGGREIMRASSVWLGPEYAKLYEGMFTDQRDWITEIAYNDQENNETSLFWKMNADFVTRNFIVENPHETSTYNFNVPRDYNRNMIGYFYGPKTNYVSDARARALVFKNRRLFTGPSSAQMSNVDFTNYHSTGSAKGYLRPMRRNFTKFSYRQ